jgi:hypothetical protein
LEHQIKKSELKSSYGGYDFAPKALKITGHQLNSKNINLKTLDRFVGIKREGVIKSL